MKTKVKTAGIAVASAALVAGGAFAYFTAQNTVQNPYNIVSSKDVTATITEPEWNPDNAKDLQPGANIKKNPILTNTSTADVDMYGFISVDVPTANVKIGAATTASTTPLFELTGLNKTNWEMVTDGSTTGHYVFKYKGTLAKGQATEQLFDSVTYKDVADNSTLTSDQLSGNIDVTGYLIQAQGMNDSADALAKLQTQLNKTI